MRWSWKRWQAIVQEQIKDADAWKLAEVWPAFARTQPGRRRAFWAHEMLYEILPDWSMTRVMHAANILEAKGLASRCPGLPAYAPEMPEVEQAEEKPRG
jgi:hypothetical protein